MICHCACNEYFQTDITVHLVFPDVLRKPPLPYRGNGPLVIVSQHHSWHSHKALTASSLIYIYERSDTDHQNLCERKFTHFQTIFNPVNPTYLRSYSYPAIQKCDYPPALSIHICLHSAEISILFTVFAKQHCISISQTFRLGIKY